MPTYDEDLAAATAALQSLGASDPDEAQRFTVMFRALMAPREAATLPPATTNDIPLLFAFPSDPLSQADRELLQRARTRIDELLAT